MLKKVSPNDPLNIPASTYNAFIDATRDFQKSKGFKNSPNNHSTPYYVQNKTGKRLPIYSVLMITDLATDFPNSADDTENLNYFIGMKIVFKGEIPDKTSKHFNKILITQEPLEIDAVGIGIIDGISKCAYKVKEGTSYQPTLIPYFAVEHLNTDYLLLQTYGTIETVFIPSEVPEKVRQGVCNLNSSVIPYYFLVDLIWVSGGDSTTNYEPRLYNIALNSNTPIQFNVDIGAGNNPYRRPQDYNVTKATIGLGFWDSKGEILIAWANEYPMLGTAEVLP